MESWPQIIRTFFFCSFSWFFSGSDDKQTFQLFEQSKQMWVLSTPVMGELWDRCYSAFLLCLAERGGREVPEEWCAFLVFLFA